VSREDARKILSQVNERSGKFNGSASLSWYLFGSFGQDRTPKTGKEADIIFCKCENRLNAMRPKSGQLTHQRIRIWTQQKKMRNPNLAMLESIETRHFNCAKTGHFYCRTTIRRWLSCSECRNAIS
jgi:hypothetical protein